PAPYPVQADIIEVGQISTVGKIGKGLVVEPGAGTGCRSQLLGEGGLRWIKIGTAPLSDRGGGMQVDAHALPEAQFASAAHFWWCQTGAEESELYPHGVKLVIVAKNVTDIGYIASSPVRHG